MVNFNKMPGTYWDDKTRIEYLQRQIIVHSILYYELNYSVISDKEFDSIAKQLVDIMDVIDVDVLKETQYYYCMYDFDGTTGFDLYNRLSKHDKKYLMDVAKIVCHSVYSNLGG